MREGAGIENREFPFFLLDSFSSLTILQNTSAKRDSEAVSFPMVAADQAAAQHRHRQPKIPSNWRKPELHNMLARRAQHGDDLGEAAPRRSLQARVVWGSRVVTVGGGAPVRVAASRATPWKKRRSSLSMPDGPSVPE